jgi:hypothetical protein
MTHEALVREALGALSLVSTSAYVWLGQRFLVQSSDPDGSRERGVLVHALTQRLYADFYCAGGAAPPADDFGHWSEPWPSEVVAAFSRANRGRGCRDDGWVVRDVDGDAIVVEKDDLRLWARSAELVDTSRSVRAGDAVAVLLPREVVGSRTGFYTAYGDAGSVEASGGCGVDRYYWNVRADGRARLLELTTARLNRAALPFRFKVLNDPETVRCDAAVLYAPRALRDEVTRIVAWLGRSLAPALGARTPVFAKRLAPGLAFAEDPLEDESFGTHRCRLMAEAIVASHERGLRLPEDRLDAVAAAFDAAGLSFERPYLNPGSDDPGPEAVLV